MSGWGGSRAANEDTQSALRQDSCEVTCEILTVAPPPPDLKGGALFLGRGVGRWRGGGAVMGTGMGTGRSMVDAPRSSINIIRRSEKEKGAAVASLPSIVFDHVSQLDDELSLFVLLTALKRVLL